MFFIENFLDLLMISLLLSCAIGLFLNVINESRLVSRFLLWYWTLFLLSSLLIHVSVLLTLLRLI